MREIRDPVLKVENLMKRYQEIVAVRSVSFKVSRGEILGLLGPNGAGKTTLIAMLLGVLTPTSGTIEIFGKTFRSGREDILSRVNFSSTYVSMPLSLTVRENLIFFAKLYEVRDYRERISDLLKSCGIGHLENHLARELSSGEMSRLNLAKALLNRPQILFLDEPTASLDPDMADQVRSYLVTLKKDSATTIIYTSHNMREIEQISDRVLFLNRGEIIADGSPREIMTLFRKGTLEEVFLKISRELAR